MGTTTSFVRTGAIVIASSLLSLSTASAGPLESAISSELSKELENSAQSYQHQAMEARVKAARADLFPAIKLKGIEARRHESVRAVESSLIRDGENTFDNSRFTASISQPIFDREIYGQIAQAKAYTKFSQDALEIEKLVIAETFLTAYLEIAKGKELRDSFARSVTLLEQEKQKASQKLEANLITVRELNSIGAMLLNTQKNSEFYNSTTARSRSYLDSRLVGGAQAVPVIDSQSNFSNLTAPAANQSASFVQDAEVLGLKTDIELLNAQEATERAKRLPKVSLVAQYEYDDAAETVFGGPNQIEDYEVGIQLEWKLFRGGQTRHKITEISALRSAKQARLNKMLATAQGGLELQISAFEQAKRRLELEQEVMRYREELNDASERAYQAGKQGLMDRIGAQMQLEDSRRAVISAKYDLLDQYVRMHSLAATLLDQAVPQIDSYFN
jgi:outer membrane protein TolC